MYSDIKAIFIAFKIMSFKHLSKTDNIVIYNCPKNLIEVNICGLYLRGNRNQFLARC